MCDPGRIHSVGDENFAFDVPHHRLLVGAQMSGQFPHGDEVRVLPPAAIEHFEQFRQPILPVEPGPVFDPIRRRPNRQHSDHYGLVPLRCPGDVVQCHKLVSPRLTIILALLDKKCKSRTRIAAAFSHVLDCLEEGAVAFDLQQLGQGVFRDQFVRFGSADSPTFRICMICVATDHGTT